MDYEQKREAFLEAVKPLHDWLCKYGHPHMTVIVTQISAEASEGVVATSFIKRALNGNLSRPSGTENTTVPHNKVRAGD